LWDVYSQDGPPLSVGEQLRGVFDVQVLFVVLVLRSSLLPLRRVYRFATFRPVLGTRLARRAEIPRPLPLLCLRHVRHQPFHSLQLSLLSSSSQSDDFGGIPSADLPPWPRQKWLQHRQKA